MLETYSLRYELDHTDIWSKRFECGERVIEAKRLEIGGYKSAFIDYLLSS